MQNIKSIDMPESVLSTVVKLNNKEYLIINSCATEECRKQTIRDFEEMYI